MNDNRPPNKLLRLVRRRLPECIIAWSLFTAIVLSYDWYAERLDRLERKTRDDAPVTDYFEVHQVAVPNFKRGDDPVIIYDRSINQPFHARVAVEIQKAGDLNAVNGCTTRNDTVYDPDRKLPKGGPSLFWFIGHKCDVPPGDYRLYACWDVHRWEASTVHYCKASPIFTVEQEESK